MAAPTSFEVVAPVAVLKGNGTERYLYRGAQFTSASFDKDSVDHSRKMGLIKKVEKDNVTSATTTSSDTGQSTQGNGQEPSE